MKKCMEMIDEICTVKVKNVKKTINRSFRGSVWPLAP